MEIVMVEELIPILLEGVQNVHQAIFNGDVLKEHKLKRTNFLAFIAMEQNVVVGFKLGYEEENGVFYSWLGGVHPDFQQRGIAKALMDAQHEECKKRGYQKVRTFSRNEKIPMLILNLKCGFHVISTFVDAKGRHKIVLEKALT